MPTMAKKKKPTPQPILDQLDQNELDMNKLLQSGLNLEETCYAIDLEVSWFGGSVAVKNDLTNEILDALGVDRDEISIAMKLFSGKKPHPAIKKANKARDALTVFRDLKTFPLAKISPLLTTDKPATLITSDGGTGHKNRLVSKDAGIRVIAKDKLDDFIEQIQTVYGPAVMQAIKEVNEQLPQIIEYEKQKKKEAFDERDYPKEVKVAIRLQPRRIGLGIDFEKHCPVAAKALRETAQKQLTETVELAASDFVDNFLKVVKSVMRQIGFKIRLRPGKEHPQYGYLHEAEVVEQFNPADNPITYKVDKQDQVVVLKPNEICVKVTPEGKTQKQAEYLVLPLKTYNEVLKPYQTEERRRVVESSLDGFLWQIERFREISEHLGPAGESLGAVVQKARDMFSKAGSNLDQVLKEMRESHYCRKQACEELAHVQTMLESMLVSLPAYKGRRRAVNTDTED